MGVTGPCCGQSAGEPWALPVPQGLSPSAPRTGVPASGASLISLSRRPAHYGNVFSTAARENSTAGPTGRKRARVSLSPGDRSLGGPWVTSARMRPTQLGRPVTWPFQPGRCRDTALMDWRLRPSPRGGIAARRQRPSRLPPPPLPPPPLPPCESSSQSREPGGPRDTGPSLICLRLEAFRRGPASRPCQRTPTHVTESPPPGQSSPHRKPCTCTAVWRKQQVWGACSAGLVGVQSLSSALTATPDPAVPRARK